MSPIILVLALTVTGPRDAVVVPANLPGQSGLILCEWTPRLSALPIFNHFLDAPRQLHLGMHYDTYTKPVIRLVIGATHVCRTDPVKIVKDHKYTIIAFWRHVGSMFEAVILLDGKIVGYLWEPARPYKSWKSQAWIGMRAGGEPVTDPSFPGVAHADGVLSISLLQ